MKNRNLHIRMTEKRYEALKAYAEAKEKTVTQLIEDWVDRLPKLKIDDFSTNPLPNQPNG